MQNLLLLLARYGNFMLFLVLEVLCFYLIVKYNQSQQEIYLNSSNLFSGYILDKKENMKSYMGLKELNEELHQENARLLQRTFNQRIYNTSPGDTVQIDTSTQFSVIAANVINNSVRYRNNTITLNKGSEDGIKPGMGVITTNGIVGVVRNVSKKYAQVISVLNSQARISAKIKRNNYHGNVLWRGGSPLELTLEAIPKHADIQRGDTICTSGYSSIFPKGIMIGTIESFDVPPGNSNYVIDVKMNNDLARLENVYVIENLHLQEIKNLENE